MKKTIKNVLLILFTIAIVSSCNLPQSEEAQLREKAQVFAGKLLVAHARDHFSKETLIYSE